MELTSEQLPEILKTEKESKRRRSPTVTGEGYKISGKSVSAECTAQAVKKEWYRVRMVVFRLLNTFR